MADMTDLSAPQQQFLEWLLMTPETRELTGAPTSQKEYAATHKIDGRRLREWKNQTPKFVQAYRESIYRDHTSPENMHRMLDVMRGQILDGSASPTLTNKYLDRLDKMMPPPSMAEETVGVQEVDDARLWEAVVDAAALRGWTVTVTDADGNPVKT